MKNDWLTTPRVIIGVTLLAALNFLMILMDPPTESYWEGVRIYFPFLYALKDVMLQPLMVFVSVSGLGLVTWYQYHKSKSKYNKYYMLTITLSYIYGVLMMYYLEI